MAAINESLLMMIKEIHFEIIDTLQDKISQIRNPKRAREFSFERGDISYDIDIDAESIILKKLEMVDFDFSIDLVMEGIGKKHLKKKNAIKTITIIIDPIDGTREIMYNKRSAWILTGIAFKNEPKIKDIEIAIQTEIPTSKQNEFSHIFSFKGSGAYEEIYDKITFNCVNNKKRLKTSQVNSLADGYICFPNPFPRTKIQISKIYESFYNRLFPERCINEAKVFSDEYISTGGQIYLLSSGCYRVVVDIREYVQTKKNSLCCHPYDLCTVLIAIEAGAVILNLHGTELDYPLDTTTNCNWIGFANQKLKEKSKTPLFESIFNK